MEHYKNLDLKDIVYFCEYDFIWKTEQWEAVKDYEGLYEVSDLGRVKSLSRIVLKNGKYPFMCKESILKQSVDFFGYTRIGVYKNGVHKNKKPHQLVGESFLNHKVCGFKLVINHKNFIKTDNYIKNLEITTTRENTNLKHIKSSSNFVGVSWHKRDKKWTSRITINGEIKNLGYFINELDAHQAYQNELYKLK